MKVRALSDCIVEVWKGISFMGSNSPLTNLLNNCSCILLRLLKWKHITIWTVHDIIIINQGRKNNKQPMKNFKGTLFLCKITPYRKQCQNLRTLPGTSRKIQLLVDGWANSSDSLKWAGTHSFSMNTFFNITGPKSLTTIHLLIWLEDATERLR